MTQDTTNRFPDMHDGGPGLGAFLGAAEQIQDPAPVDQDAVRSFVMNSDNGELLESMLTDTLRLGRMQPEAEAAIQQDKQAIIASIKDPKVELTPSLAEKRDRFYRQIAPVLSLVGEDTQNGDENDSDKAVEAAKKVLDSDDLT